jgi:hypothetical protein
MKDDGGLSLAWIAIIVLCVVLVVAMLVGAIALAIRLVRTRRLLTDLGAGGKIAFYGALIYTIFPIDLLPDPIYLDDVGVLTGALIYLTKLANKRRAEWPMRPVSAAPGRPMRRPMGRPPAGR